MSDRMPRHPWRRRRKSVGATFGGLVVVIVVAILNQRGMITSGPASTPPTSIVVGDGERAILEAFGARRSGVLVRASGIVKKNLPDDADGDRHQRLIVALSGGHTVLIAHNIDLAPRVPAREGDAIEFQGDYEWSQEGGVIHWTHHDPARRRDGGWLRHQGQTYE